MFWLVYDQRNKVLVKKTQPNQDVQRKIYVERKCKYVRVRKTNRKKTG